MDAHVIELTERDKQQLRVLLREQARVAYRRSEFRRDRGSAKHLFPKQENAESRTA